MGYLDTGQALGYLQSQGWTPAQSAGILGNLHGESGFNSTIRGDGGKAYGLAQWHPDRQANFARVFGKPITRSSPMEQLQFVNWELNNTEKRAGNLLRQTNTVEAATYSFMKHYERPANSSNLGARTSAASKIASGAGALLEGASNLADDALKGIDNFLLGGTLQGVGILGDCNWFCQFKNWITESGFFQRVALAVLAFIILLSAFQLFKSAQN